MNQNDIYHYFDWAATSPADEDILRTCLEQTIAVWGNPSSIHTVGKKAHELLEQARCTSAAALGVAPDTVYFTSGGTEGNHIPLLSLINRPKKGTVLISALEHPAVRMQAESLIKCGWHVNTIPATRDGFITAEAVLSKLTDDTALVCVMAVNNEMGAIQNIYAIADALESSGNARVKLHVDCVQAAGKIPLDISHKAIASASFSAHKLCGPRGTGIAYLAHAVEPFLRGGGQERNMRSGTENVYGALAFSKCLERYCITQKNTAATSRFALQKKLTKSFIEKLAAIHSCTVIPETRTAHEDEYSPWIVQAAFKNMPGQVMLRALDAEGFFISTGSACSSRRTDSRVLQELHVRPELRENAVRFSFGPHTTEQAMQELAEKTAEIAAQFA
ncbi:MAG: cysteine desulfurase [Treponema sp.]|nr:cysteine desulfurase [Treponema sp.]